MNYSQKFEEGCTYHIYNRSIEGINLFCRDTDYTDFLDRFIKYCSPYFKTYAYCLIPNHFHFLVSVREKEEIRRAVKNENTKRADDLINEKCTINEFMEDQIRRYFSGASLRYNHRYKRRGPLFSERFKRLEVNSHSKFQYLLCYIHHNPIHHHLCEVYGLWKYCSYQNYLSESNSIIAKSEVLNLLGGLDVFTELHEAFKLDMASPNT